MSPKLSSILLGGLVAGILSTSYLGFINLLCCLGIILGGVVAVWHYTTENELTIPGGEGAAMGAAAAVVGTLIALVLNQLLLLVGIPGPEELIQNAFRGMMNAEQIEAMEEAQRAQEAQGITLMSVLSFLVGAVVGAIFGAIGGAIGAAVFKKGPEGDENTF